MWNTKKIALRRKKKSQKEIISNNLHIYVISKWSLKWDLNDRLSKLMVSEMTNLCCIQYLYLLQTTSDHHISGSWAIFFFFLSSPKKAFVIPNNYVCIWLSPNCLDWISFASLHLPFSTSPKHCCTVWSLILFIGLLVSLGQYHSFTLSWRPLTFSFIIVLAFLGSLLFHLHFLNVKKHPFIQKKQNKKSIPTIYCSIYPAVFS